MTRTLTALLLLGLLLPASGWAYEASTTHPGISTQAMLASRLHAFLRRDLGYPLGLFTRLRLHPPAIDRRELYLLRRSFRRLDPAGGYRPDPRGRLHGAGWLLAGSVLGGMPGSVEQHHFLAPALGRRGLDNRAPLLGPLLAVMATIEGAASVRQLLTGTGFELEGQPASAWAVSGDTPYSLRAFHDHMVRAVASEQPEARDHHLALALAALGGVLHALQDMASPTHVRNDYAVGHLDRLGSSAFDRGSAYERLVALGYGQHGIPRGQPVRRARLVDYFSAADWRGLADLTSLENFSPGTVPRSIRVLPDADPGELRRRLARRMVFSRPELGPLDLGCARRKVCYQRGPNGPRLAYRIDARGVLSFFLDGACHSASARQLLPLAVGYSAGLIDHLLRGRLELVREATRDGIALQVKSSEPLRAGTLQVFVEEASGRRQLALRVGLSAQRTLDRRLVLSPRPGARALAVLLDATDAAGERLVASARLALEAPASAPSATATDAGVSTKTPTPASAPATAPASAPRRPRLRPPKLELVPGARPGR